MDVEILAAGLLDWFYFYRCNQLSNSSCGKTKIWCNLWEAPDYQNCSPNSKSSVATTHFFLNLNQSFWHQTSCKQKISKFTGLEICEIRGKMSSEKNFCFEFCNLGNNFNEKVHNYDKFLFEHTENRSSISKRTYLWTKPNLEGFVWNRHSITGLISQRQNQIKQRS